MLKATRFLALLVTGLELCAFAHAGVNVPDWVRQAAAQNVTVYDPETNAVVLLDDTAITLSKPGEYVEHQRRVVRILRPEGRANGQLLVYLTADSHLLSLHAWSIAKDGHEYELKEKDFNEVSPYTDELYSDLRYRLVNAPAAEPGAVVALEYEVRRKAWLNQYDWGGQERIPIHLTRLTLNLPPGWEYKTSTDENQPLALTQPGPNSWQWAATDVPAIETEPLMPSFRALSRRLAVTYFGPGQNANSATWEGLGHWYNGLTAGRRDSSPNILEKVQELTAGKTDFDGKAQALAHFMQSDIRYVAIEIGVGGFQPHFAREVFHARYGDCKDKVTLLSTMLKEVGILSDYVLIDSQHDVVKAAIPSSIFNHAILAIELPDPQTAAKYRSVVVGSGGQSYLIFDPTDPYTPLGSLRADLQHTYALLVTPSGGELIQTSMFSPDTNVLARNGQFSIASDGKLEGVVTEKRSGDHASWERHALMSASQQQRSQHFEKRLNRSLQGFTLQSADVQHLDQNQQDLSLTLRFTAPQYGQVRGPLMLVRPRVLGEESFAIDRKPRKYAVLLGGASRVTDTYEMEIPSDYAVDDTPEPARLDVGFASYQSKIDVTGSKVRYWRELIVRDYQVAPEHIADLRKLEALIGADENAAIVLKRTH